MDIVNTIVPTLTTYLVRLPVLLVWFVAFILSLVFWRRHPKVSLLTVVALAILFVQSLVGTWLSMWLPLVLNERGMSLSQIGLISGARGVLASLISCVAWVLLVIAIFGWREKRHVH